MKVTSKFELRPFVKQTLEELVELDKGLIGTRGCDNPTYRERAFERYGRAVGALIVLANVLDCVPEKKLSVPTARLRKMLHILDRTGYVNDSDTRDTTSIALVYVRNLLKELDEAGVREEEDEEDEEDED